MIEMQNVLTERLRIARYPEIVIGRILEGMEHPGRLFETPSEWRERILLSLRAPEGKGTPWWGRELDVYLLTIRCAEIMDTFEARFVELLRIHPRADDDGVGSWLLEEVFGDNDYIFS